MHYNCHVETAAGTIAAVTHRCSLTSPHALFNEAGDYQILFASNGRISTAPVTPSLATHHQLQRVCTAVLTSLPCCCQDPINRCRATPPPLFVTKHHQRRVVTSAAKCGETFTLRGTESRVRRTLTCSHLASSFNKKIYINIRLMLVFRFSCS